MGTRSYICKENKDGTFTGIFCHWDGYLEHNGAMLIKHYQNREKVEKLISLGDMSCLEVEVEPKLGLEHSYEKPQKDVCIFYGRDRGETDTEARQVNLEELNRDVWIEYVYIYGLDNKWRYFEYGKLGSGLGDLEEAVNKLDEVLI